MPTIPKTFGTENKRKLNASDFYETPYALAKRGVELAVRHVRGTGVINTALDPALGTGVYARALVNTVPNIRVYGLDIEDRGVEDDLLQLMADNVVPYDFRGMPTWRHSGGPSRQEIEDWPFGYDLIVTNPPFSFAEDYIRKGWRLLNRGGVMCYLLKAEFYTSQHRSDKLFGHHLGSSALNPTEIVVPYRSRVSFDGSGKTNTIDHVYYLWVKEPPEVRWNTTITWQSKGEDWKE